MEFIIVFLQLSYFNKINTHFHNESKNAILEKRITDIADEQMKLKNYINLFCSIEDESFEDSNLSEYLDKTHSTDLGEELDD